jgi:Tfp pilus assembly protein PilF
MRLFFLPAAALAVLLSGISRTEAQEAGELVIVVRPAPLKSGHEVLETLLPGLPLHIREVQGDWLAVANRRAGWLHRSHVRTLPESIEHFSAEITRDPKNEAAHVIRGVLWQTSGDHDQAIADFTTALRLNGKNRLAYSNRAIAWKQKGEYELALEDYHEALRIDPQSAMTWHNRGAVWAAQGKFARAVSDFREAIRLDPELPDGYNALAWLQATCSDDSIRNAQEALNHAVQACELTRYGRWNFLGTLAAAHAEAGQYQEAVAWERKCLELAPPERHLEVRQRLEQFLAQQPYRDPPPIYPVAQAQTASPHRHGH